MKLLLAEDDADLGRATCVFMMRDGHAVDWVTNGTQVLSLLGTFDYACVILDLGLPDLAGDDCLRNMRSRGIATPVIVTTARGHRDDRIGMLDLGADDYLVKPFDLAELSARILAVVRRDQAAGARQDSGQAYGPMRLLPARSSVEWHGKLVILTIKEFTVLQCLLRRIGRPVTRKQLEDEVYGWNEAVGSNSVEVHVHHLRKKIDPDLIQTIRGLGYQIGPF